MTPVIAKILEVPDVIVVGAGNAGMSAALAANERGASVLIADAAPADWSGGNSYFTAGAFRTAHPSLRDVVQILDHPDPERLKHTELAPYTVDDYVNDLRCVTQNRCDPVLSRVLAEDSWATMNWLHARGLRFRLMYERQSYSIGNVERFWGGLAIGTVDGGKGLVAQHFAAARSLGIQVLMEHKLVGLDLKADRAIMTFATPIGERRMAAPAVVIAAGGFESDPGRRAHHLGEHWRAAKVRGTPYNTGHAIDLLLQLGAAEAGQWSGCHATQWDRNAPDIGDRELTNRYTKQSYPLGIVVNVRGDRFIDEGEDFRNLTYAKYGRAVLEQPDSAAFQIFDAKTAPLLRSEEYGAAAGSHFEASTIYDLAQRCGLPVDRLSGTVAAFNAAVTPGPFDPTVKDGKAASGIHPPKSNWAQPIDTPPFLAYPVTGAITFTFGGVKIDQDGRALNAQHSPLPRVFVAGEAAGGLFYDNYPGGSGLMAGSVFGRRAGYCAAACR